MKHFLVLLAFLRCVSAFTQDATIPFDEAYKRKYSITQIDREKIAMDGKLNDSIWLNRGTWTEDFVQVSPNERQPTPSRTRAKLFYDDKYLYVGIWAKDIHPERINRFIGNRDDNSIGDLVSIALDTYHNFWAAPEFNINAGGNKTDLIVTDKLNVNLSWNAVWEGRTQVNLQDSSWTAEIRIPFSQLRYNQKTPDGIWGLHIRRIIRQNNEVQNWSLIPLKNNGHVFSFGEMHGMDSLPKSRNMEFLPYVMGKYQKKPVMQGPYQGGTFWKGNAGLDAKFGLSDYTLDVTVNPDYGQVDLDPSVMNLTAYETFYDEKRPFFLEGKHILDFAFNSDVMMFYTRRIGAIPSYQPRGIDGVNSFAERLEAVPILEALKLTGTNNRGLTLGALQSLTAQTSVKVSRNGVESNEVVEPLTNFSVARVQKNWKGNTLLGGMITAVNRFTDQPYLQDYFATNALTSGVDFTQYFKNRLYYIDFKGMFSRIAGNEKAMIRRQLDPVHYFQRVSAQNYLGVDTAARSLSGTGGFLQVGRKGNAKWTVAETFAWVSPGFDLNDVGYLREADILANETEIAFRQTQVWKWFRSNTLTLSQANKWNYDSKAIENDIELATKTMFLNRYELELSETYLLNKLDTRVLRGGPDLRIDPYFRTRIWVNTDKAKRLIGSMQYFNEYNAMGYRSFNSLTPGLSYRWGDHIFLSGNFNYQWNSNTLQYVGQAMGSEHGTHYLMGTMSQRTYGLTMKIQANITPDISIQFYGAPFTSTGMFDHFKRDAQTDAREYNDRFHEFTSEEITRVGNFYQVTENGETYSFKSPDFNFNEFRSNLVVRWEYRRGSTLSFVWGHSMSQQKEGYSPGWDDNLNRMFGLPATNTWMLKLNYWFGL